MLKRKGAGTSSVRKIDIPAEVKRFDIPGHHNENDQDIVAMGFHLLEPCDGIENIIAATFLNEKENGRLTEILENTPQSEKVFGDITFACIDNIMIGELDFRINGFEDEPITFEYGLVFGHMNPNEMHNLVLNVLTSAKALLKWKVSQNK